MSSSFVPDEENDYIPQNILLTGGAGKFVIEICDSDAAVIVADG